MDLQFCFPAPVNPVSGLTAQRLLNTNLFQSLQQTLLHYKLEIISYWYWSKLYYNWLSISKILIKGFHFIYMYYAKCFITQMLTKNWITARCINIQLHKHCKYINSNIKAAYTSCFHNHPAEIFLIFVWLCGQHTQAVFWMHNDNTSIYLHVLVCDMFSSYSSLIQNDFSNACHSLHLVKVWI